ncbi:uncharacterized protein LOC122498366 [Leptopilina heterotoma]|uniref:uncharacterized protein LOC122498366 n=1 Tax=Leptopilina heterotoma TaxID=63436 RepID=UPI001CAA156B|nr:uncharacterized protein LOC122498366 [Leptopilina heterotoma]
MTRMHTGTSLIQEPWLVRGAIRGLGGPGLVCYRDCRAAKPRGCILTKGINVNPLLDLCSGDLMIVVIDLEGIGKTVIGSANFPYDNENNSLIEVRRLVEYCMEKRLPLLLGCDANSQHTVWRSTKDNQRGQELLEYLIGKDLDILNTGSTPTFINAVRQEVIDITLCSKSIENKLRRWRVSNEPSLSDHSQIVFEVESAVRLEAKWIRNPRKTDWAKYNSELRETLSGLPGRIRDHQTLDEVASNFTKTIKAAYENSYKPTKVFSGKEACWWNEKLECLRKKTRRLFKRAKQRRTASGWSDFTKMREKRK